MKIIFFNKLKKAFVVFLLTTLSSYALGAGGRGLFLSTQTGVVATGAGVGAGAGPGAVGAAAVSFRATPASATPLTPARQVNAAAQAATASSHKRSSIVLDELPGLSSETGKKQKRITDEEAEQHKRNARAIFARTKEEMRKKAVDRQLEALARIEAAESDTESDRSSDEPKKIGPVKKICPDCPLLVTGSYTKGHRMSCHPIEPYEYQCHLMYMSDQGCIKQCKASFQRKIELSIHKTRLHSTQSEETNKDAGGTKGGGAGVEAVGASRPQIDAKGATTVKNTRKKPQKIYCDECPYRDKKENVMRHKINNHPETPWPYVCNMPYTDHKGVSKICAASYQIAMKLKQHQKKRHAQ